MVYDLEQTPWPWETGSVEAVRFYHALEHMGADPKVFLAIMAELWRVCTPGAVVEIDVPHPRHDNFIDDPTHVRIISPRLLSLFDRRLNDEWKATGQPNTPFAHYLGIDFETIEARTIVGEPWASLHGRGEVTAEQVADSLRRENNVAEVFHIKPKAHK